MSTASGEFDVKLTGKSVIKAAVDAMREPHILPLSNLDLLSGRFPVTYLYFYKKPPPGRGGGSTVLMENLKKSLSETLAHYYPFAGQIVENPSTGEPEIVCNNTGALLVESKANIHLKQIDFYNLNSYIQQGKLVSIDNHFPFQIQVTSYNCGGLSITFSFDHALGDASAFAHFLRSWSQISNKKPISAIPDHSRSILLHPRSPPIYDASMDRTFVACNMEDILNMPTNNITLKRLYYIHVSTINMLQKQTKNRTKIEGLSAYIWKAMGEAVQVEGIHKKCNMGWLVDGRSRINVAPMSNYIGNVLSVATGEASVEELRHQSISFIADMVHAAIMEITNEDHYLGLIDWIEVHRPGIMISKAVLGRGDPTVVLSSGRQFPVAELEFGFGSPVLGTVCSTIQRIGVCYMNQRESSNGDGSWVVSAILSPQLAAVLESDALFHPISANYLQF